jgi:imidazolonepropionase-like amidohydrolase
VHGYRCDRAFDGERSLPGGALVLVDGGRIVDVRPGAAPAPDGCPVTHEHGATLLPGLVDTHVHLCGDAGPDALAHIPGRAPEELERVVRASLLRHVRAGVTTVRDLGDHRWAVVDRVPREDEPRVLASGPPITAPGGHCATMGGEARGPDALARAVRERADRGADVVKIMVSGGAMTAGSDLLALQYDAAELALVVRQAHAAGLPVVAHAHPVAAVEACLAAGVDAIEHATCLTGQGLVTPEPLLRELAAAGTWVCPTLGRRPGSEPSAQALEVMARTGYTFEARFAQVGRFAAAGVRLVSGSDAGIHPGKPHGVLPHAVAELVLGGIAPEAALRSATSTAADACGLSGVTGAIRTGLDADLLIVNGDPRAEIGDLARVRRVVRQGREVT